MSMSRTSSSRRLAIGVTVVLAAATSFTTGAGPAAAAGTVRVMQFNICGAICNQGVIDGSGADVVEDVRNRIARARPALAFLQEVCVGQFNRLKSLLSNSAWKMSGVFRPQRNDPRCRGGSGFGDAVLTAGFVGQKLVFPLPNLGSENRAILCLRTSAGGPVLACTLHLVTGRSSAGAPEKYLQLAAAAKALNQQATRGAVVTGGDFNVVPSEMGSLLDPARGGQFFDVDPEKAPTHGRKIDYILFSRAHFSNPSGGPQFSPFSDHRVLLGQATRVG
jgi:endonuclease/exonuclease/phosphatase family metal-dependent hydrolase